MTEALSCGRANTASRYGRDCPRNLAPDCKPAPAGVHFRDLLPGSKISIEYMDTSENHPLSRRVFLSAFAGLAAIAPVRARWAIGGPLARDLPRLPDLEPGALMEGSGAHGLPGSSDRIQLREPGPMLPPVPAILLTRGSASEVDAPTVEECPVHVECRVFDSLAVPAERKVFLADVVATTAVEGAVDANERLVVADSEFFGMTAGSGEFFKMGKLVGHIGQTVGRDDIRY